MKSTQGKNNISISFFSFLIKNDSWKCPNDQFSFYVVKEYYTQDGIVGPESLLNLYSTK